MANPYKDILSSAFREEFRIIEHLYTKIPEGGMDYRPTEGQRSTLELLRYIATMGEAATGSIVAGNWDGYMAVASRSENMTADEFPKFMADQTAALEAMLEPLTDEDLLSHKAKHITGKEVSLFEGLMGMPLKWITGYRMQLFLYAKQAGNSDIGTSNCWVGTDAPKKD